MALWLDSCRMFGKVVNSLLWRNIMKMITATEANRDFSKILEQVSSGKAIGITKRGKIVATLNPARPTSEDAEAYKMEHLAELRSRKPIPGLTRGTRDELYDDE